MESPKPEFTTPAMRILADSVEEICKLEVVCKHRHFSHFYLKFLDSLVNPTATMTEDQARAVVSWIVDWRLPNETDYPKFPELLPIATFINSCKA